MSKLENFFYHDTWPDWLFINGYPVLIISWNIFLLVIPFLLYLILDKLRQSTKFKKIWQCRSCKRRYKSHVGVCPRCAKANSRRTS